MHRRLVGASLLLAALFVLPSLEAVAQNKKKGGSKKSDVPVDSAKLSGEFVGLLKTVPGTERLFTVDVESKNLVSTGKGKGGNANANRVLNLQNQIAQQQLRLNGARTAQQRLQAAQQLQRLQLQLQQAVLQMQQKALGAKAGDAPPGFKWVTKKQAIEFQAAETVKVRSLFLPEQFDDKGNLKTYTEKEKAELKGKDRSLPGYESSLEKLEVGQKVRVKLAPAPRRPATKEKDKDSDTEASDADKKMQVTLIVILEEGSGAPPPKKGKAKGKGKKAK